MRVAITKKLLWDVEKQVRTMRNKELHQISTLIEIENDETGEWFLELWWKEHIHLKDMLPDDWKGTPDDSYVQINDVPVTDEGGPVKYEEFVVNYEMLGDWDHTMPPSYNPYANIMHIPYEQMPEQFRPGLEKAKQYRAAEARWNRVQQQVTKFLSECPSLNKALELWPDFRVYVPQNYLDTVALPTPKRTKRDLSAATSVLDGLDKGTLMAAKVRERLQQAEAQREANAAQPQ